MRAIQEELGDKAKKESDIEKIREDIKKANVIMRENLIKDK